jgi:hypothetical protein
MDSWEEYTMMLKTRQQGVLHAEIRVKAWHLGLFILEYVLYDTLPYKVAFTGFSSYVNTTQSAPCSDK